jgi:hypothetical protein
MAPSKAAFQKGIQQGHLNLLFQFPQMLGHLANCMGGCLQLKNHK